MPKKNVHFTLIVSENYYQAKIHERTTGRFGQVHENYLEVSANVQHDDAKHDRLTWKYDSTLDGERDLYHYRILTDLNDRLARWTSRPEDHVSPESLAAAFKALERRRLEDQRRLKAARLHPAHADMVRIVGEYIKHYDTDFWFHDRMILAKNPDKKFLWIIRPSGSDIYIMGREEKEDKNMLGWLKARLDQREKEQRYFIYEPSEKRLDEVARAAIELQAVRLADRIRELEYQRASR